MFALFVILAAIMVVDIAALTTPSSSLSSSLSLQSSRNAQRSIDTRLTPSQVPFMRKKENQRQCKATTGTTTRRHLFLDENNNNNNNNVSRTLVPSQVSGVKFRTKRASSSQLATTSSSEAADEVFHPPFSQSTTEPKKQHNKSEHKNTFSRTSFRSGNHQNSRPLNTARGGRRRKPKSSSGNLPDVLWRHIPLEHVRKHPHFCPLPDPDSIRNLESLEDVRNFRQESWQWDVLHEGRMTTSQAVAALGFLEPLAGEILGVPRGLRRGGQGAYYRLRKPPAARTLDEMNARLCCGGRDDGNGEHHETPLERERDDSSDYWTQPPNFPFAAKYMIKTTQDDVVNRKDLANRFAASERNQWSIRMVWGNVQEATSLLTALNYFWQRDKGVSLNEIGMCGAGLEFNQTSSSSLMLGATPDAVLCHSDGRIEAVEVKNHCPFVPNNNNRHRRRRVGSNNNNNNNNESTIQQTKDRATFRLSRQTLSKSDSIMCQYIPQLMMEMLCLGETCESAIMVRQTATNGSLILRIHRDNDWIEEMLYWLGRFHRDFVDAENPPPPNFFLQESHPADRERYERFLELTKQIEEKVELLEHVPHRSVQRATAEYPVSMDLFLD